MTGKAKIVIATRANLHELRSLPRGTIIEAYKLTTKDGRAPIYSQSRLRYRVGANVSVKNYNSSDGAACGQGLNVGTRKWVRENVNWMGDRGNNRYVAVHFRPSDIVAMPLATSDPGKFRVKKLRVVRELNRI